MDDKDREMYLERYRNMVELQRKTAEECEGVNTAPEDPTAPLSKKMPAIMTAEEREEWSRRCDTVSKGQEARIVLMRAGIDPNEALMAKED